MAKSKSGGTRAYIRGKIGADVYSIGKTSKGQKQQVVRSLAEVVSNPQTESQMRNRMIMSTVMQAVSALSPIIDHAFDAVPSGQPAISEFIRVNHALIKADAAAHPSSDMTFGLVKYQEKGAKSGLYIIADGKVAIPASLSLAFAANVPALTIALTAATLTVGGLKSALGLAGGDYITLVGINANGGLLYGRAYITDSEADTTAISSDNVETLFTIEANDVVAVSLDGNSIKFTFTSTAKSAGVILSKKENSEWNHSKSTMQNSSLAVEFSEDIALPTYPQGASRFLNGGDL